MKSLGQNNFKSRRSNRGIVSRPIVFVAAIVCVVLFIQFLFPLFFPTIFSDLFSTLWSSKNGAISDMTPRAQLLQENQSLRQQLAFDEAAASSSKALIDQNNELKALLGRPSGTKNLVLSNVLRRPPGAGYDYLVIDAGSLLGAAVGYPVYSTGSTPVGQIIETEARSSKVELYSSPGTTYDALIGANHVPATASGQGGGFFSASLSRESGVSVGDEVIIPAISSMPLGAIAAIIADPTQPFEKILFGDGNNPEQSDFVLVEIDSAPSRPFAGSVVTASSTSATSSASTTFSSTILKKKR